MVVSHEFLLKLEELKNFWSNSDAGSSRAELLEKALDQVLAAEKKKRFGKAQQEKQEAEKPEAEKTPPPKLKQGDARNFSTLDRQKIWRRARGQCEFVSKHGRRCEARSTLQVDHLVPFSHGGASAFENGRLLCRAHNNARVERFRAELDAGVPESASTSKCL
jgi:hypothetical protein